MPREKSQPGGTGMLLLSLLLLGRVYLKTRAGGRPEG